MGDTTGENTERSRTIRHEQVRLHFLSPAGVLNRAGHAPLIGHRLPARLHPAHPPVGTHLAMFHRESTRVLLAGQKTVA